MAFQNFKIGTKLIIFTIPIIAIASVVVPRIKELKGSLGADYATEHGRFPLPATFAGEVAEDTAVLHYCPDGPQ